MMNYQKYSKGYFMPPEIDLEWAKKDAPDKAPIWCSVDMRDGNQALIIPMNLDEKLEFYKMLLKVGFKEIEVGFPAASETEYEFLRRLVEDDLIPDDVTIQVLTQAREHIIRKTFDALKGVKNAIVHVYNSTSVAQRQQVFRKSKDEIKQMAVDGAKLLKKLTEEAGANYRFEYSPESFTGTEPEYALEVCNAVLDVWQPTADRKAIINLPVTVEMSMPHVYAMQVAYMNKHLKYRDNVVLSLHPHNDRGCGVADTEMGILAGADRVEGTLFGNGERTGNVDIVTVGMNMFALGVDPELDFSNMSELVDTYERLIRINSQSGKGGVGFIMEQKYGIDMPKKMREDFGYCVKGVSDHKHKELMPDEIYQIFQNEYVNIAAPYELVDFLLKKEPDGTRSGMVDIKIDGKQQTFLARGNGRLDAVSNALQENLGVKYTNLTYSEHALEVGQNSRAMAYIGITGENGHITWGAGMDTDIITASIQALISAINRMKKGK